MAAVELRLDPFMVLVFDGGLAVGFAAVCAGSSSRSLCSIIMSDSSDVTYVYGWCHPQTVPAI